MTADSQKTYHYNYADRLMSVDIAEDNVLYNTYDQSGQRTVKQSNRTIPDSLGNQNQTYIAKTTYPNAVYEEETQGLAGDELNWQTKKTRHITLGNQTIAHIDVNPQGQAEKILVFSDHLGSSSLLTDSMGRVKTLYDYYPFGGTRLDSSDGLHVSAYQYTGKELDVETGLNYYGARYYEAAIGRFSQGDPVSLALANPEKLKKLSGKELSELLSNPQNINSYAYALNNPIIYVDPDGNFWKEAKGKVSGKIDQAVVWVGNKAESAYQSNVVARWLMDNPNAGLYVAIAASAAVDILVMASAVGITSIGYSCVLNCGRLVPQILLQASTKTQALSSINDLPEEVQNSTKSFFKGGSNAYNGFAVTKNSDGTYTAVMVKPGDVPGSQAVYIKQIDSTGKTTSVIKNTYDPQGNLVNSKDK